MSRATADVDLEAVDLSDPDVFEHGPPHELFARMRGEAPVHLNRSVGHTKHRMIVQKVFTPHTVNRQEDQIHARVNSLIDRVCERGECDFVSDIAVELPLQTIAGMLGVPHEDRGRLFEWTNRIEAAHTEHTDDGLAAFGEMGQYLAGLIEQRRSSRTDDLISRLMAAEVAGERLADLEITSFFGLLMFAGSDTTRNTASGALQALLEHPDQSRALASDPGMLPGGVEEILRWVTPVMWFKRTATRDVEIRGVPIREGQKVVPWYASGSRDEEIVSQPMELDVTRRAVEHQAFGGGGRHFCLGASLARLQLRVLFAELLRRLPDVELAGPPCRLRSNWVNGLTSLPIRFTPQPAERAAA